MCSDTGVGNALNCLKSQQLTQKCRCAVGGFRSCGRLCAMYCGKITKLTLAHFLSPVVVFIVYNEGRQHKVQRRVQVLCCTKASEFLNGWNIHEGYNMLWDCRISLFLSSDWSQRPPLFPLRESRRECRKQRERLQRSNTKKNRQLQFACSRNPEGRRGPNCKIT